MTREPILLVGAGGHSKACIDVIEQEGRFKVKGLIGLPDEVDSSVFDYPVLGTDEDLPKLVNDCANAIIVIGQIKTLNQRIRFFDLLQQNNCVLPAIVSPRAYVSSHAILEAGTIVMHGAVVNVGAMVGKSCMIKSRSLIEHDVIFKDHCHIATATTINSGLRIGTGTFVGSNTNLKKGDNNGGRCVIRIGQQVLANCETGVSMP